MTDRATEGVFAEEGQDVSALKKGHFGGDAGEGDAEAGRPVWRPLGIMIDDDDDDDNWL